MPDYLMLLYTFVFFLFSVLVPVRVILHTENSLESVIMHDEVEEDEVWLYWIDQNKEPHGKSIRNMSLDAKNNHKEDIDNMTYYRSGLLFSFTVLYCLVPFYTESMLNVRCVMFKCIFRLRYHTCSLLTEIPQ